MGNLAYKEGIRIIDEREEGLLRKRLYGGLDFKLESESQSSSKAGSEDDSRRLRFRFTLASVISASTGSQASDS